MTNVLPGKFPILGHLKNATFNNHDQAHRELALEPAWEINMQMRSTWGEWNGAGVHTTWVHSSLRGLTPFTKYKPLTLSWKSFLQESACFSAGAIYTTFKMQISLAFVFSQRNFLHDEFLGEIVAR